MHCKPMSFARATGKRAKPHCRPRKHFHQPWGCSTGFKSMRSIPVRGRQGDPMTLEELMETVPAYARDLKLNFSMLTQQPELTSQQVWGTIVASAVASRSRELTRAVLAEAAGHLSPQALEAAKGAAAIMGMNN